MADANLKVNITAVDKASKALGGVSRSMGGVAKAAAGVGAAIGAGLAIGAVFDFGRASVTAAQESEVANAKLAQVFRSMGDESGKAAEGAAAYASELSKQIGVEDEAIIAVQTKLATFKAVSDETGRMSGVFDRTTQAAYDLAAAGFGTAESNATQLGKALQDPVKGLAALTKSGVTFTAEEKKKIATLVESGRALEAQDLVLQAIEKQVGGTAKSGATNAQRLSVAWGEVQERVGGFVLPIFERLVSFLLGKVIPAAERFADWIGPKIAAAAETLGTVRDAVADLFSGFEDGPIAFAETMSELFGPDSFDFFVALGDHVLKVKSWFTDTLIPALQTFGGFLTGTIIPAVATFGGWLVKFQGWLIPIGAAVIAIVGALKAYAIVVNILTKAKAAWVAVQTALNVVLAANPIGLVILAVVGLVAAIIVAYKRSETFRNIVQGALKAVGAVFVWLKDTAVAAFNWIKTKGIDFLVTVIKNSPLGLTVRGLFAAFQWLRDSIGKAVQWVGQKFSDFVAFFKRLPAAFGAANARIKEAIMSPFKSAFNAIARLWNRTVGNISFSVPSWVPGIGGNGFSVPKIPEMAVGGKILTDGLIYGHAGEKVTPAKVVKGERGYGGTSAAPVVVNISGVVGDRDAVARVVEDAVSRAMRRGSVRMA